jgi:tRNA-Thr(GGU) m(6)t(6)A37 methyltransferase TsaA
MQFQYIGIIRSEFPEKFGLPKQPGLVPELKAVIELSDKFGHETLSRGLDECSHIWVIFHFHQSEVFNGGTVRPPLLGGEKRMGVFATRAPHRPNPIGLSLVKNEGIEFINGAVRINVSGHDFVDGTPVLDVKPYVASYDRPHWPYFHWSDSVAQNRVVVLWSQEAIDDLERLNRGELKGTIEQVLALDPRPRVAKNDAIFGMSFAGLNIKFQSRGSEIFVAGVTVGEKSKRAK